MPEPFADLTPAQRYQIRDGHARAKEQQHAVDEGKPRRCDCSCHSCCIPLDASCEDCEEEHPEP